jgi:hypothetical protein
MGEEISDHIAQADRTLLNFQGNTKDLETAEQTAAALAKEGGAIGNMFKSIRKILGTAIRINSSSGGSGGKTEQN